MRITSPAFRNGEHIPHQYSRYGEDKIPPLRIEDVPMNAQSLALIMDDPDAPRGLFTHWLVFNIDPKTTDLGEDHAPKAPAHQGTNSWGEVQYGGPRPPSGEHRYFFHLYAVDRMFDLPGGSTRHQMEEALNSHVLAEAKLMARFAAAGEAIAAH
jgi:Raf kinase inhibitor-like YbhB/YbcL family protein